MDHMGWYVLGGVTFPFCCRVIVHRKRNFVGISGDHHMYTMADDFVPAMFYVPPENYHNLLPVSTIL
ncbi:hypothetical protein DKX38_015782 [Salix brachista]|uniref:Uncharacterized protein n=1 Tax=Salix brachista TaxID=2182728 RepID=A0A5N5L670_9ROSI|nr:hypothetical protein DKX38_015782 [Salix brachista]